MYSASGRLYFVVDQLMMNLGDESYVINAITSINQQLVSDSLFPVSVSTAIDFDTNEFVVRDQTVTQLLVNEISGKWFMEAINDKLFRYNTIQIDEDTDYEDILNGDITSEFVLVKQTENEKYYHLGETIIDGLNTIDYYLVYDEVNDDMKFIKVTNGDFDEAVEMSVILYRDNELDSDHETAYNFVLVEKDDKDAHMYVVTDTLTYDLLETSYSLNIKLKNIELVGVDYRVVKVNNIYYLLTGDEQTVTLGDDVYTRVYDGNSFESNYIKIDNTNSYSYTTTIKKGQPVFKELNEKD